MTDKRTLRRIISEWLLGGGALIALVTGAISFFDRSKDRIEKRHQEACARAHDAILDDGLNPSLPEARKDAFIARQLYVASVCAKDVAQ